MKVPFTKTWRLEEMVLGEYREEKNSSIDLVQCETLRRCQLAVVCVSAGGEVKWGVGMERIHRMRRGPRVESEEL